MEVSFCAWKQPQLPANFPAAKDQLIVIPQPQRRLDKAVVVIGATGSGKSRLSVDLATRFNGEVINSDKMQVYKGLDIVTNKISAADRRGVSHHLIGVIDDPEEEFTAEDFVRLSSAATDGVARRGCLPIIAGGSNSFVEALTLNDVFFRLNYDCCFLWVDVSPPVLHSFVSKRVDEMVAAGMVAEGAGFYQAGGDYSRGVRRAIGVPEMHEFYKFLANGETRVDLLEAAIDEIKANTCELTRRQLVKIGRMREKLGRRLHRLDATEARLELGGEGMEAWERSVLKPGLRILERFLHEENEIMDNSNSTSMSHIMS